MLIIFDVDGTLVSASRKVLYQAYIASMKAVGIDHRKFFRNQGEFFKWWTGDWRTNRQRIGIKKEAEDMWTKTFYEVYNPHICLFLWAESVISKLAESHWLAVLTNRHRTSVRQHLRPVVRFFNFIVGAEDVEKLKPYPEGVNLILEKIKPDWGSALIIGDRPEDILAGKAAGIKTGAVKWGLGEWKELLALEPDYYFETYEDLTIKL